MGCLVGMGLVQAFLPRSTYRSLSFRYRILRQYLQYAPYLRTFANTLSIVSLSKIENAEDDSAKMMKRVWNAVTIAESS